jgi:hypothetical protein
MEHKKNSILSESEETTEPKKIMTIRPYLTLPFLLIILVAGYTNVKMTMICLFIIAVMLMMYLEQNIG